MVIPYGYVIVTFPQLSLQLGMAIKNVVATAIIVANNITPTQMT